MSSILSAGSPPLSPAPLARRIAARAIDDGILLALAVGLANAVSTKVQERVGYDLSGSSVLQLELSPGYLEAAGADTPSSAVVITLLLLLIAALAYYVASSATGRTPGRAALGLAVARADGRPARSRVLVGRELLRITLISLCAAVLWPLGDVLAVLIDGLGTGGPTADLLTSTAEWLPLLIAITLWIGATLVDPQGRAPHDRLAGTRVVTQHGPDVIASASASPRG